MNIHELDNLKKQVQQLKDDGVYRILPILESASKPEIKLDGVDNVINLSANNYLGLATNERMKKAAINAIEKYGVGTGSVRTIIGNMDIHEELEKK